MPAASPALAIAGPAEGDYGFYLPDPGSGRLSRPGRGRAVTARKRTAAEPTRRAARHPANAMRTALHGLHGAQRQAMIAEAAYFLAERRGFAPGQELADWLQAEAEIERLARQRA